ncbi:hypothetical protein [Phocaeicola coprophilus]|uniref:hypothetical protein n=1 Tax=Phocaeicola coprophilus TaxID=387090 RepID=UPI001D5DBCA6|nr:hypothetical protein [Phocaeicola coprophilus]HJE47119.1 hypothetical protein [Phocaeicola coprophilus]
MELKGFVFTKGLMIGSVALLSQMFMACSSDSNGPQSPGEEIASRVVTARWVAFDGGGQAVESDSEISDMQACLFEDGVLTKVYRGLSVSGDECTLQVDRTEGNLYMLANTSALVDWDHLQDSGMTEEEWLKTVVALPDSKSAGYAVGSVALETYAGNGGALPLNLKRGMTRLDLKFNVAGTASLSSLTLSGIARSAYLFPQSEGVKTPEGALRADTTLVFDEPLSQDASGVLYLGEQENQGIQVEVVVSFDGESPRRLRKSIEGDLKRNTIYTVTIRKDDIDIVTRPVLDEWEQGYDTELVPL